MSLEVCRVFFHSMAKAHNLHMMDDKRLVYHRFSVDKIENRGSKKDNSRKPLGVATQKNHLFGSFRNLIEHAPDDRILV